MLELYYFPDNASLAPHLLLAETRIDYRLKLVDRDSNAQRSIEYLKLNPAGRIPTRRSAMPIARCFFNG